MKKKYLVLTTLIVLTLSLTPALNAAENSQIPELLVVNEAKSFELTMRVQGFVGALKNRSEVVAKAKNVEVGSPTENPLEGEKDLALDVVIIVPHTIETGSIKQIWIVTRPLSSVPLEARSQVRQLLAKLKDGVRQAFSGKAEPVGVNDDFIPAYFSTLFLKQGVLR